VRKCLLLVLGFVFLGLLSTPVFAENETTTSANSTTIIIEASGPLDWLTFIVLIAALVSPILAYTYGLIGGLVGGFFSFLSVILSWYQYSLASEGLERDLWYGLAWISLVMFFFSISLGLLKGFQALRKRRRTPRFPDLDL